VAELRELIEPDLGALQALIERCGEYYLLTTGSGPTSTAARDVWDALPPGLPRSAKLTLGLFEPGLVAIADVVRGWPRPGTWLIGLLLLDPAVRGRGTAARIVGTIDARAADAGADRLRVAVVPANTAALSFWQRLGFGEVPSAQRSAIALERPVTRH
jgi:GNAT superfamily N-acetyltransferase